VHVKHVSGVTFIIYQRISVKYHEIIAKMSNFCTDTCLEMLFTFQQNSALARHTHETIGLLQHDTDTPNFIPLCPTYGHLAAPV